MQENNNRPLIGSDSCFINDTPNVSYEWSSPTRTARPPITGFSTPASPQGTILMVKQEVRLSQDSHLNQRPTITRSSEYNEEHESNHVSVEFILLVMKLQDLLLILLIIENDTLSNGRSRVVSPSKRKRLQSNKADESIGQSLSQLSISNRTTKKTKTSAANQQSNTQTSTSAMQNTKPRFLRTPDGVFKEMLLNAATGQLNTAACLNTKDKVQQVRVLAEVTSHLRYVELQRQLWQEYYNIGMKDNVWGKKISKSKAKQLAVSRSFGFPKPTVEQRQATIVKQLNKAMDDQENCTTQLRENTASWEPPVNATVLIQTVSELVKNGQRRLQLEFDFKKNMLAMNSNDYRLIKEFDDLKPTDDQVSSISITEYMNVSLRSFFSCV